MNTDALAFETNESLTGYSVYKTEDSEGTPTVVVERGTAEGTRLMVDFGMNGESYCTVISDYLAITGGDAVVSTNKEPIVTIEKGTPIEGQITLEQAPVQGLKSVMVKEEGVDQYYNEIKDKVNNARELYDWLEEYGIHMSRAESGTLAHTTDYVFKVGPESKVDVSIAKNTYLTSHGFTVVSMSKGIVIINTKVGDRSFSVIVNI